MSAKESKNLAKNEFKNQKERNRVFTKNESLFRLREKNQAVLKHMHQEEESVVRWTEHRTLSKTIEVIKHLESVCVKKGLKLPQLPKN